MAEGTDWISTLNNLGSVGSLEGAFTKLLFLPIAAFFVQAANLVEALFDLLIEPAGATASNVASLLGSIIGGAADIIMQAASASAGDVNVFGIGAFPIGIGIAIIGAYVLARGLSSEPTGNLFAFVPVDVPFFGVDEEEEG